MSMIKATSRILGESDDLSLFLLTKKLADILNSFSDSDIEDTSPRPDEEDDGEYDTSEDLQSLRYSIVEWAEEARNLLPDNKEAQKAVDTVVEVVRHYMRHETRDCLHNLSEPWAEFLRNNPTGPQFDYDPNDDKYRAKSLTQSILMGDPFDEH